MQEKILHLKSEIEAFEIINAEKLELFKNEFTTRKSKVALLFDELKNVPNDQKRSIGQELNHLKQLAQTKYEENLAIIEQKSESDKSINEIDLSLPLPNSNGARHPLTMVRERMIEIFSRLGFALGEGPEIEDDWHNFTALNFPPNHPAREMQDTFFIERNPDIALRTHTSSIQIRVMESNKPPIKALAPGRVFRNEAISARAHCVFHQLEGFYIDENVSFLDLKNALYHFVKEMFGQDINIRFRPSFFPFTEPSAEIDISCLICKGKGCNVCKHSGWVEIGGAGMIDPQVLENCSIDSKKYTGYAFGMGIERIAMLKYQIKDLRLFTENDLRFLKQFDSL
ncbi:MAG: phenylalanine--tRNA ligase subunit alpha [Cytophagales bacterium]|nr:MAG: phenylalanine--tRNA ligase subunit alpha [Cytophagales bacterium]